MAAKRKKKPAKRKRPRTARRPAALAVSRVVETYTRRTVRNPSSAGYGRAPRALLRRQKWVAMYADGAEMVFWARGFKIEAEEIARRRGRGKQLRSVFRASASIKHRGW